MTLKRRKVKLQVMLKALYAHLLDLSHLAKPSVEPESLNVSNLKQDLEHARRMLASNTSVELIKNFNPRRLGVAASRCTNVYVDHIVPHTTDAQVQHLFSAFGEIYSMEGPQPYFDRHTNSILQHAFVNFQDARSALLAFNCLYDDDFSAAAHKYPEVQHVTHAKWPEGKLAVLLEEHLPTLSTDAKKRQQTASPSQAAIDEPAHDHGEQHVFSGPSRSHFHQQQESEASYEEQAYAFYQQQGHSGQCIMQQARCG